ncbi:MAG: hypothetical protein ABI885_14005 [Gammaproteobacteria bacterium]
MKGTVLRPVWPAPGRSEASATRLRDSQTQTSNRLSLALIEDYAIDSKARGFDPYNTDAGRRTQAPRDIWSRKSKRD